jgi:hypothetical protein
LRYSGVAMAATTILATIAQKMMVLTARRRIGWAGRPKIRSP